MIIKIAKENDIEFVEKVIKLNDLNSFASVFLSGTSPKILPINRINNHTYQTKNDIMSLISKSYNKTLDEYVTSFKWSNYE
jgi:branched-chain amino acid aminotransferase